MKLPKRHWQEMTSADFAARDVARWIAVLPVSAIEQHGPHLPLATDRLIGEGLLREALARMPEDLPVTVLPMQAIGKSNEHSASPGTLTLTWQTVISAWLEIGEAVHRAGLMKLILINSHGGNVALLDIVAQELRVRFGMLAVAASWMRFGIGEAGFDEDERAHGIHGGDIETSLMLHFHPELVRVSDIRNFDSAQRGFKSEFRQLRAHGPVSFGWLAQDLNPSGAIGDATRATAEKGKALATFQAGAFIDLCVDVDRFDPGRLWQSAAVQQSS